MSKMEIVAAKDSRSQREGDDGTVGNLASQIMNIMEQGIIVWSAEGVCELHNTRIYEVLEISANELTVGTPRDEFLALSASRDEMKPEEVAGIANKMQSRRPYNFDRKLPSGRVIAGNGRPARGGGFVVTYTDVTEARNAAVELEKARQAAEEARTKAQEVLDTERVRQNEAHMLAQLDQWLQSCRSLDELFQIVTTFMSKLLPGSRGQLFVYSNSRDVLDEVCVWNTDVHQPHIAPDSCWALRRGRSYAFEPEGLCFVCDHVAASAQDHDGAQYICVPIVAHGDTVGMLHILLAADGHGNTVTNPNKFAVRCGEHISMAIANVKLRDELQDQSTRDPLTGLYNRRFFMDVMRREIATCASQGTQFSMISFDADKFKTFNDSHGHDAGDVVLQAISDKMGALAKDGGVCCRLGGEEFAILLPGVAAEDAMAKADRLRVRIEAMQVRYVDGPLPRVTISAGVATYPEHGKQPQDLLKKADEAMYRAKDAGRNRIVCAKNAEEH